MVEVIPVVLDTAGVSTGGAALPGVVVLAPGAVTTIGRIAGGAIQTSRFGDKIIQAAPHVKGFIEGATIVGPPSMTIGGGAGYLTGKGYDEVKKRK